MRIGIVSCIILIVLCFIMTCFINGGEATPQISSCNRENVSNDHALIALLSEEEPEITISYPEVGYLYFTEMDRVQYVPLLERFELSFLIDSTLRINVNATDVDHVKFTAITIITADDAVMWDNNSADGFCCNFNVRSGLYKITAYAYDDVNNEIGSCSTKVIYLRFGSREDFGIWIRTRYNNHTSEKKLSCAILESMLENGESTRCKISIQNNEDTDVDLRLMREEIVLENGSEINALKLEFDVETTCNTTEEYEVALEVRCPLSFLGNSGVRYDGENIEPYFCTQTGYLSPHGDRGPEKIETSFFFGREKILNPRVFGMKISPSNAGKSNITFFNRYFTVDAYGTETFSRNFSVGFEPSVELQVTFIPREFRVCYAFGEGAGMRENISFNTEGGLGLFDDITQNIVIDPLPPNMIFDVSHTKHLFTLLYESDEAIDDITYSINSKQSDNKVELGICELPERMNVSCGLDIDIGDGISSGFTVGMNMSDNITSGHFLIKGTNSTLRLSLNEVPKMMDASFGLDLGILGDLKASGFIDCNMSKAIGAGSLLLSSDDLTFLFGVENFPKRLCINGITNDNLTGSVNFSKEFEEEPTITASVIFGDWNITDIFVLKKDYINFSWELPSVQHQNNPHLTLDLNANSDDVSHNRFTVYNADVQKEVFQMEIDNFCKSYRLEAFLDILNRSGYISALRSSNDFVTTIDVSLLLGRFYVNDTFTLQTNNDFINVTLDLPDEESYHTSLDFDTTRDIEFGNVITVFDTDRSVELLRFYFAGEKTVDGTLHVSWDYTESGAIVNFQWTRIRRCLRIHSLELMVHPPSHGQALTMTANWDIGESGSLYISLNKQVGVPIIEIRTDWIRCYSSVTFNPGSYFSLSWEHSGDWSDGSIAFDIAVITNPYLNFSFDPEGDWNYKYGITVYAEGERIDFENEIWWAFPHGATQPVSHWMMPLDKGDEVTWYVWLLFNCEWYQLWPLFP